MSVLARQLDLAQFFSVVVGWLVFGAVFILRRRPPRARTQARDRRALVGIGFQGAGYAMVWALRRPPAPAEALASGVAIVEAALVLLFMGTSLILSYAAVKALGKQWSVTAQVIESHELITTGPYAWVRNPIYTSMTGMLIATGLAVSTLSVLIAAVLLSSVGILIRVRLEEKLLRDTFGEDFEEYARRVPALLPRWPHA
jgi:protein-S-isoprenylcysteine O-methyltransferase Ste14